MNKEIKARWIQALRSGNYAQGKYNLRRQDSYCCLGVLCDIVKDEVNYNWLPVVDSLGTFYTIDRADEILPESVAIYAGLNDCSPQVEVMCTCEDEERFEFLQIANLNDSGDYSFEQLADLIEKQF